MTYSDTSSDSSDDCSTLACDSTQGRWTKEEHFKFLNAVKIYGREVKKSMTFIYSNCMLNSNLLSYDLFSISGSWFKLKSKQGLLLKFEVMRRNIFKNVPNKNRHVFSLEPVKTLLLFLNYVKEY